MTTFLMPSLGADMEAGTLIEWLVSPGEDVHKGDIVAVVETEKGAIEIEIFDEGRIEKLLVEPGTKIPVGEPMANYLARAGKQPEPIEAPKPIETLKDVEVPELEPAAVQKPPAAPWGTAKGRVSPAARRLAQERGVDLDLLTGTGPGGAITSADVLEVRPVAAKPRPGLDLEEMRKAIAAAMARSKREIPHYYLQHTVDMTGALGWLETENTRRDPPDRLLSAVLYLKAVAHAISKYPEFNGHFIEGTFRQSKSVHIGFAVALRGGGLVSPGIHDADQLALDDLMAKLKDLVARARGGRLRSSEFSDPTITISSLGDRGVESLYGIIYPPQVALVGFGKVESRPLVIDNKVEPRSALTLTLAADHRVSDGHRGALFLNEIGRRLQRPEEL